MDPLRVIFNGDLTTGQDYSDIASRFIYFPCACLEMIKASDLKPDIIHCNDYQTALVPAYLKLVYQDDPNFEKYGDAVYHPQYPVSGSIPARSDGAY